MICQHITLQNTEDEKKEGLLTLFNKHNIQKYHHIQQIKQNKLQKNFKYIHKYNLPNTPKYDNNKKYPFKIGEYHHRQQIFNTIEHQKKLYQKDYLYKSYTFKKKNIKKKIK